MLKEIILIIFTTFGFTNSDVKLLELPKESKNFGASVKDYYRSDHKGNYTYIYQNDDGTKHRQDGSYGEKRGYYTFRAPLPDGRTFTVCYYTKNGYHAKTTIIEVDDVETFCDMVIEQSGSIKIQQQPKLIDTIDPRQTSKSNVDQKAEILSKQTQNVETFDVQTINSISTSKSSQRRRKPTKTNGQRHHKSKSFNSSTPFRIQTSYANETIGQIKNISTHSQSFRKRPKTSFQVSSNEEILSSTKNPFIIIEEQIENQFETQSSSDSSIGSNLVTSSTITSTSNIPLSSDTNINSFSTIDEQLSSTLQLNPLDVDSRPPSNATQFEIPIATNFKPVLFCNDSDQRNSNSRVNCRLNTLPTIKLSTIKVDELLAENLKYGVKRPLIDDNTTEIITPSKLFLPPYIDDDANLLPSADLTPPTEDEGVISTIGLPIETTIITSTEIPTIKRIVTDGPLTTGRTTNKITTEVSTTTSRKTTTKPIARRTTRTMITTRRPKTSRIVTTKKLITSTRFSTTLATKTKLTTSTKPINANKDFVFPSTDLIPPKIDLSTTITTPKNIIKNITKLNLVSSFNPPSLDLLPPLDNREFLFDVRTLNGESKDISSNIVSRSISSTSKSNLECKHRILRTNSTGKFEYINPKTSEESEAIQNVIKIYGCKSNNIKLNSPKLNKNEKFQLETELILRNCRLDIVEMDKNGKISYLDSESMEEFNAITKLNTVFECY